MWEIASTSNEELDSDILCGWDCLKLYRALFVTEKPTNEIFWEGLVSLKSDAGSPVLPEFISRLTEEGPGQWARSGCTTAAGHEDSL